MPKAKRRITYLADMDTAKEAMLVQQQLLRAMTLKDHASAKPERVASAVVAFITDCAKRNPRKRGNYAAQVYQKYDYYWALIHEQAYLRAFVKTWRKF